MESFVVFINAESQQEFNIFKMVVDSINRHELKTIDDVLSALEFIVLETEKNGDPMGYFAVLYQRVTQKVKEEIEAGYFDDGPRMEKLDVSFAQYYIDAYFDWKKSKRVSQSWKQAFLLTQKKWPVVLQHLLMGMNAHINLDLGVAAASISTRENIHELHDDFFRINDILSQMVNELQNDLSVIWPKLKRILDRTGKFDNLLVDFSMQIARDGAWEFAQYLAPSTLKNQPAEVARRDERVMQKTELITNPGFGVKLLLFAIRLGELGSVSDKIKKLKAKTEKIVTVPVQH